MYEDEIIESLIVDDFHPVLTLKEESHEIKESEDE